MSHYYQTTMAERVCRLIVFVSVAVSLLSAGRDRACTFPGPTQKNSHYRERIVLGTTSQVIGPLTYSVAINSKLFDGLRRIKTQKAFAFRKGQTAVSNYPNHFIISVEAEQPFSLKAGTSRPSIPGRPALIPKDEVPKRVVLRWHDSLGKVLDEKSLALDQVIEPWTEQSTPRVWYSATCSGNQPLSAEMDVIVFTQAKSPVGELRVCALGLCPPN